MRRGKFLQKCLSTRITGKICRDSRFFMFLPDQPGKILLVFGPVFYDRIMHKITSSKSMYANVLHLHTTSVTWNKCGVK